MAVVWLCLDTHKNNSSKPQLWKWGGHCGVGGARQQLPRIQCRGQLTGAGIEAAQLYELQLGIIDAAAERCRRWEEEGDVAGALFSSEPLVLVGVGTGTVPCMQQACLLGCIWRQAMLL